MSVIEPKRTEGMSQNGGAERNKECPGVFHWLVRETYKLHTKASIRRDRNALLAGHRNHATTIVFKDRLYDTAVRKRFKHDPIHQGKRTIARMSAYIGDGGIQARRSRRQTFAKLETRHVP